MNRINYTFTLFFTSTSLAFAHGGAPSPPQQGQQAASISAPSFSESLGHKEINGKLIKKIAIDGYELRVKIVNVNESIPDGGSHNLLVNIKRDGRNQYKLPVSATIDEMGGQTRTKSMMELGDWYLAGYDINPNSEYFISVSFKSSNGKEHTSNITYP